MNVSCPSCSARISVADTEASPFTKLSCPDCDREFVLSEAHPADEAPIPEIGSSEASAMFALSALTKLASIRPAPPPPETEAVDANDSSVIDFAKLKQVVESAGQDDAAPLPVPVFLPGPLGGVPAVAPAATAQPVAKSGGRVGVVIAAVLVVAAAAAAVIVIQMRRSADVPSTVPSALAEASAMPSAEPSVVASVAAVDSATVDEAAVPSAHGALGALGATAPPVRVAGPPPGRPVAAQASAAVEPEPEPPTEPAAAPEPEPPPPPAGKCAHCAPGDLKCHMACATGGG